MNEFLPAKSLLYLDEVSFRQDKQKEIVKKLVILHFVRRPCSLEDAQMMGVSQRLFGSDGKTLDDVESATIKLKNLPLFKMGWSMSSDTEDSLIVTDVIVDPNVAFRRHKESTGVFSARFTASVVYPSKDDLLTICHAYAESRYVTFEAQAMALPIEGEIVEPPVTQEEPSLEI